MYAALDFEKLMREETEKARRQESEKTLAPLSSTKDIHGKKLFDESEKLPKFMKSLKATPVRTDHDEQNMAFEMDFEPLGLQLESTFRKKNHHPANHDFLERYRVNLHGHNYRRNFNIFQSHHSQESVHTKYEEIESQLKKEFLGMSHYASEDFQETKSSEKSIGSLGNLSGEVPLTEGWNPLEHDLYYISEYITQEQEERLLKNLRKHPVSHDLKEHKLWHWKQLKTRKVLTFSSNESHAKIPHYITELFRHVEENVGKAYDSCGFSPNTIDHVLINEYDAGEGIMPHTDGQCYLPFVFCLSLGSSLVISFKEKLLTDEIGTREPKLLARLVLEPRSLVIFKGSLYTDALHGIEATSIERYPLKEISNYDLLRKETKSEILEPNASEIAISTVSQGLMAKNIDPVDKPHVKDELDIHVVIRRKPRTSLTFRQEKANSNLQNHNYHY